MSDEEQAIQKVLEREFKGALTYLDDYGDAGLKVLKMLAKPCLKDKTGGIWPYKYAIQSGAKVADVKKHWVKEALCRGNKLGVVMIHGSLSKTVWITPIGNAIAQKGTLNDAKAYVTVKKRKKKDDEYDDD